MTTNLKFLLVLFCFHNTIVLNVGQLLILLFLSVVF